MWVSVWCRAGPFVCVCAVCVCVCLCVWCWAGPSVCVIRGMLSSCPSAGQSEWCCVGPSVCVCVCVCVCGVGHVRLCVCVCMCVCVVSCSHCNSCVCVLQVFQWDIFVKSAFYFFLFRSFLIFFTFTDFSFVSGIFIVLVYFVFSWFFSCTDCGWQLETSCQHCCRRRAAHSYSSLQPSVLYICETYAAVLWSHSNSAWLPWLLDTNSTVLLDILIRTYVKTQTERYHTDLHICNLR